MPFGYAGMGVCEETPSFGDHKVVEISNHTQELL